MIHHEMWRDELQAWLIARDSTSIIDLLANLKYETQSPLWYLLLMPLTWITRDPLIMQAFHLLIVAITIYLVARFSPFSRLQKVLIAFGYYSVYEYAAIARCYALAYLLIVVFCILYTRYRSRFAWIGATLFLLALNSVHSLIIVICITSWLFVQVLVYQDKRTINKAQLLVGFGLALIGIIASIVQLIPPDDIVPGVPVGWYFTFDQEKLKNVISCIETAFLPVPTSSINFWQQNGLWQFPGYWRVYGYSSVLLPIIFSLYWIRKPMILLLFWSATAGLLIFFYVVYFGELRNQGFLYLTLLLSIWLSYPLNPLLFSIELTNRLKKRLVYFEWNGAVLANITFTLILFVQVIGGITAIKMDSKYIFSNGKQVAEFIRSNQLDHYPIVADSYHGAVAVLGYLVSVNEFFWIPGNRFASFVRWDDEWLTSRQPAKTVAKANQMPNDNVLVLTDYKIPEEYIRLDHMGFIKNFTGATRDNFFLYLFKKHTD